MAEKKPAAKPEKADKKEAVPKAAAKRATTARAAKPAKAAVARKAAAPKRAVARKVAEKAPRPLERAELRRARRRTKVGVVRSAKQAFTVIVEVGRLRQHPLYKKVVRVRKRFAAHDATREVKAGDLVRIQESRPFSATKRWQVIEVLSRAGEAGAAAPLVADIEKALEQAEGVSELLAPVAAKADVEEEREEP